MSILERYGKLPTVEEMMAALASPVVPKSSMEVESEMELSTDDMIREMFTIMKHNQGPGVGGGGGAC